MECVCEEGVGGGCGVRRVREGCVCEEGMYMVTRVAIKTPFG